MKSKPSSISRRKYFLITIFGLFWTTGILIVYPVDHIIQPFLPLPPKITLSSYPTYMLTVGGQVTLLGAFIAQVLALFFRKKDKTLIGAIFNYSIILGVIVCLLGAIPRYYLGQKIEKAQYILCEAEQLTSGKISWDVYAKSEDLCKPNNKIASKQ